MLGDIANGWIPPGIPGFEEAGGLKQNTDLDYLANPAGDPAVAKKYMLAAKKQDPSLPIDANGKWTGGEKVLTVADQRRSRARRPPRSSRGRWQQLGFKLELPHRPAGHAVHEVLGVPKSKVAVVPERRVGSRTSPTRSRCSTRRSTATTSSQQGNVNWPQLNDPAINAAMKAASVVPVGADRNKAWAKINHMIAEQAPAIPWIWDKTASVGVEGRQIRWSTGTTPPHDLSFTSLK